MVKILLVDDYKPFRECIKMLLEHTSSQMQVVAQGGNGLEAIQKVEEHTPDVVIIDVGMPLLDGLSATKRIKDNFPNTKVIILTGEDDWVKEAKEVNADGYVTKDKAIDDLAKEINKVLNCADMV